MTVPTAVFDHYLALWDLVPEGEPRLMPMTGSRLLAVRWRGQPAMLKLAGSEDERRGGQIMQWWNGQGAAPVYACSHVALLMARASGATLVEVVTAGEDARATTLICRTLSALHAPRPQPPASIPLAALFRALLDNGESRLSGPRATALKLLSAQTDQRLLHGDMHHANVLDFGPLGWLSIDPWGVTGERAYDYANLFRNPTLAEITRERFLARRAQIAREAGLDPERLTGWAYAHAGLSAAWDLADGHPDEAKRSFALIELIESLG